MSLLEKSSDVWRLIYARYDAVLKAKSANQRGGQKNQDLLVLDKWYQHELPKVIISRSEKYVTHEELSKLMKWKLKRGKFRPRLQQMVEENSADSVKEASEKAFKALPNLKTAIEALTVLKAVGPATASAVLAAGAPKYAPFMADESMMLLPGLQPLKYTLTAYLSFAEQISSLCKVLQKQDKEFGWTPHLVELTLWTQQTAQTLQMDDIISLLNAEMSDPPMCKTATAKKRKSGSDTDKPAKRKA